MLSGKPSDSEKPGLAGDIQKLFSQKGTMEGKPTLFKALHLVLSRPGPLAIVFYRASHTLWKHGFHVIAELLWRMSYFLTGADIHPGADIGGGLRITHTSGIVIGKGVVVGRDVNILHGVTLGGSAKDRFGTPFLDGYPRIGDRTEIWAGAKVLGPVQVGNDCQIGANAVLVHDLADGAVYTPGREVISLRQEVAELTQKVADLTKELADLTLPSANDTTER